MTLLEQTQQWLEEHQAAGRDIEAAACRVRLKILERCGEKSEKPEFISKMRLRTENEIETLRRTINRGPLYEHYKDDLLLAHIKYQAIVDFSEDILEIRIENVWPRI